ncbi:alpha/beta fold hydrolase [Nocardioides sp. URHA0020]|uniref:alpha/beta fold hydrolase n=1 Tax=Nocardioides sp. URHA0020 TaxID=1380392 RepID=UPI000566C366|nr:alpha/beta hydrolase [Nocardioides sp. URHA0020]
MRNSRSRLAALTATASAAVLAGVLIATGAGSTAQAAPERSAPKTTTVVKSKTVDKLAAKPTIVLVHGAFADSSGWNDVIARLTKQGFPVLAFSNPLRGPVSDGEYLRQFLSTIPGNIVLVGHSYGGAVITNAAAGNPNVKALVYVAAYAPEEGESVAAANELGGGHTDVTKHLVIRPFPGAAEGDADAFIDPKWFHQLFAQDLKRSVTAPMAVSQRPGALAALGLPSGPAAWKTIKSWFLVAKQDRIIPPQAERAMAKRAGAKTVVINSSHVAMMSHPKVVTNLIRQAATR